jgi:hypothetical protein
VSAPSVRLSRAQTAATILLLGASLGLVGDACHVASETSSYRWEEVPTIWRSAIWFPLLVGVAVLVAAWVGERWAGPPARRRGRIDALAGAAAVLGLYALTAAVSDQPDTVSVTLCGTLAVLIWLWWDPSPGALALAAGAAVAGPLAEIGVVELGASAYAEPADSLAGVPPWLPCLYFAAGAVASRLWDAIERDGGPRFHRSAEMSGAGPGSARSPSEPAPSYPDHA